MCSRVYGFTRWEYRKNRRLSQFFGNINLMKIKRSDEVEAWQLARELTRKVYESTKKGKFAQDFD